MSCWDFFAYNNAYNVKQSIKHQLRCSSLFMCLLQGKHFFEIYIQSQTLKFIYIRYLSKKKVLAFCSHSLVPIASKTVAFMRRESARTINSDLRCKFLCYERSLLNVNNFQSIFENFFF